MKKLYFIRHGQSQFNLEGRFAGTSDPPLTALGKKQAKVAGRKAKKLDIDCIVSSPSIRTLDTAKTIAKEIGYPINKILVSKLFMERDFGPLEAQPWSKDISLDENKEVESREAILKRAELALAYLHSQNANNILVVSHGSIGRAIRSYLQPIPYISVSSEKSILIPNAEIIQWV